MRKKALSLLTALTLCVSYMVPTAALAEAGQEMSVGMPVAQSGVEGEANYLETLSSWFSGQAAVASHALKAASSQASVTTAPTAIENLTYDGTEQALVTAGAAEGGTMVYRLGDTGDFDTIVPVATNAGEYTVWYKAAGDGDHGDSDLQSLTVTIAKAAAPTSSPIGSIKIINGCQKTYTYDCKGLLPQAPHGDYGTVTWKDYTNATTREEYISKVELGSDGVLSITANSVDSDYADKVAQIWVHVQTDNYEDISLDVYVSSVNKVVPQGTPTMSKMELTYGEKLSSIELSGTMKDGNNVVEGTFMWENPDVVPPASSGYSAKWKFVPKDGDKYKEAAGWKSPKVNKATVTVTAKNKSIHVGDSAPALGSDDYTVSGLVGGDTLTTAPTLSYVDASGNVIDPDTSKAGKTAIRASGADAGSNYEITYVDGALTVSNPYVHTHSAVTVAGKAATCTEDGLTQGSKCSTCGAILKKQEVIPALGHDWGEWAVTKPATLKAAGAEQRVCQREGCGTTEGRAISKLDSKTVTVKGVIYTCDGKTAVVTGADKKLARASVLASIKIDGTSYPVTGIAAGAFKDCKNLKSITITSKKLTKKSISGCFKGSNVGKVTVQVGSAKQNKAWAKGYAKLFTKKVCGKKGVAVKASKKPLRK